MRERSTLIVQIRVALLRYGFQHPEKVDELPAYMMYSKM